MNKYLNNNIYQICFSFCFFSETPPFPNVNDLYKQFTSRDLLLENVWYIRYINAILKWMGVDMNECIEANSKNWVLDRYWSALYSCRIQPSTIHTRCCPVLYLYWVVMDCTVFISDLYCIPDDDTKTVLLSTVFLQLVSNSTVFISAFYCIPKTGTNTVLSSTMFIPAIRYPVSVYGTWWYRNNVQNGTIRYLSNTVYREYGIGTVPVFTIQQYWNGTVQYRNVYWGGHGNLFQHTDILWAVTVVTVVTGHFSKSNADTL